LSADKLNKLIEGCCAWIAWPYYLEEVMTMKTRSCRAGGSIGARPATGLCLVALLSAVPMIATAQTYPTQPLKLIVPYTPGGAADVIARQLSQGLAESLGQSVLIDNRPGANTIVAAEVTARSAPDGYTLLLAGSSTLALNPSGYKSLPYDVARDFAPVARVVSPRFTCTELKASEPPAPDSPPTRS